MLCGTYQAFCPGLKIPMENLSYEDQRNLFSLGYRDDFEREGTQEMGFSPVWMFPMETMRDAAVHALMTVADKPYMFLVYDIPDEFIIKVDWVQHDRYPNADPADYTVYGNDTKFVELVVPETYFGYHAPLLWCFVSNFSKNFFENLHLHYRLMNFPESLKDDFYSRYRTLFAWFEYATMDEEHICHTADDFTYKTRQMLLPFAVACVPFLQKLAESLPYIHKSDGSELPKMSDISLVRGSINNLLQTYKDFVHDAAGNRISKDKYEYYYDRFSSMVRDPVPKLETGSLFEDVSEIF